MVRIEFEDITEQLAAREAAEAAAAQAAAAAAAAAEEERARAAAQQAAAAAAASDSEGDADDAEQGGGAAAGPADAAAQREGGAEGSEAQPPRELTDEEKAGALLLRSAAWQPCACSGHARDVLKELLWRRHSFAVLPRQPATPLVLRCRALQERLQRAEALKKEGNDLYARDKCEQALVGAAAGCGQGGKAGPGRGQHWERSRRTAFGCSATEQLQCLLAHGAGASRQLAPAGLASLPTCCRSGTERRWRQRLQRQRPRRSELCIMPTERRAT